MAKSGGRRRFGQPWPKRKQTSFRLTEDSDPWPAMAASGGAVATDLDESVAARESEEHWISEVDSLMSDESGHDFLGELSFPAAMV